MVESEIEDFDFEDVLLILLFMLPIFILNWIRQKSTQNSRGPDPVRFSQPNNAHEEWSTNYEKESGWSSRYIQHHNHETFSHIRHQILL